MKRIAGKFLQTQVNSPQTNEFWAALVKIPKEQKNIFYYQAVGNDNTTKYFKFCLKWSFLVLKNDQNTVNACQIFKFDNFLKKKYRLK